MGLPSIHDFTVSSHDPAAYAQLPEDWWLAVADVIGSTRLAAVGRDRDVNFVAGAIVAALSHVLNGQEGLGGAASCQFGGDGAMAAVPPQCRAAIAEALTALAHWATVELDVPLRVGMVPVSALSAAGLPTLAALQVFGNGDSFGQFLGAGAAAADRWVKADERWRLAPWPGPIPGLEQLSCRWRPVAARRGTVLCVIVDPLAAGTGGFAAIARLQAAIEAIAPTANAGPLGDGSALEPKPLPTWRAFRLELHTERPGWRRWRRALKIVIGSLIILLVHRLGGRLGPVDTNRYRRGIAERSDYRKQAGGPRLVLDVTPAEADRIEAILGDAEAAGEIVFGTSRADSATITCLVGDFSADRHVHFVDGTGLGFWRASVALKDKLKTAPG
ncbi:MAG: DUF3095 family protein [Rhodospirillaceae bacterium]